MPIVNKYFFIFINCEIPRYIPVDWKNYWYSLRETYLLFFFLSFFPQAEIYRRKIYNYYYISSITL